MSRLYLLLPILLLACSSESSQDRDAGAMDATPANDATPVNDAAPANDAETADAEETDAGTNEADASSEDAGTPPTQVTLGPDDRPAPMKIPQGYAGEELPLVVLLHGYSVDAATQDLYFAFSPRVDARKFFLILPDGTQERSASAFRFWNATDACCNFYGSTVDDVGYLTGLIDEAEALVNVGRVYVVGHSNGGFMAYRMACDRADRIDAIVSLAGATFMDEAQCDAARPISVLQIHGTADATILYDGVAMGPMRYPGAEATVDRWATRAACALDEVQTSTAINLDMLLAGDETEVEIYREGCTSSVEVELWRIQQGSHIPNLVPDFGARVLDWLFAH